MILTAAGLLRKDDHVVIVQQAGPEDRTPYWTLPGGVVKDHEFVIDALLRELLEETGLAAFGSFRHAFQVLNKKTNRTGEMVETSSAIVLEGTYGSGRLRPSDPDGYVLQAKLVPVGEAIRLLSLPVAYRFMNEPIVSYLRDETQRGAFWSYRSDEKSQTQLVRHRPSSVSYRLRPAAPEDHNFLYQLKRSTLKEYITQTWGWDEKFQFNWFRDHFDPSRIEIIQINGLDSGQLSIIRNEDTFFLETILISPESQKAGLGSTIILDIIDEARNQGVPVNLQVLKVNPAVRLYERLGFRRVAETTTHFKMKAR